MTLYEFAPNKANDQNLIVLLSPDKRGDTNHYKPYLQKLAENGITVYSADFFADDGLWLHSIADKKILRRVIMVAQSFLNPQVFESQREFYSYNISQEYSVLIPLLKERCGADKKFLLITDFMADIAADGILKLSNIEDYKSSGYGCIEQTDPVLAMVMGLQRDRTLATPKLLAEKTVEVFNDIK